MIYLYATLYLLAGLPTWACLSIGLDGDSSGLKSFGLLVSSLVAWPLVVAYVIVLVIVTNIYFHIKGIMP